jgi:hypothetical protein
VQAGAVDTTAIGPLFLEALLPWDTISRPSIDTREGKSTSMSMVGFAAAMSQIRRQSEFWGIRLPRVEKS